MMTYEKAVETINSLLVFGSKPGLERVRELVDRIGSPDKQLKFIHVAGTNGKGSVCAYLSEILHQAGYKTGMFISPFVIEFRERFQINGEMIPKERLASITEEVYPVVEAMKAEGKIITEFEMVLAVGLKWFAEEKCDIVVLETGLGGRFDATNIISVPLVSVIMSISLDHTAILGDTAPKIAFEKCGIIKAGGTTVLYGEQPEGVLEVVQSAVNERHNHLLIADPSTVTELSSGLDGSDFLFHDPKLFDGQTLTLHTPLIGQHQLKNAAAALNVCAALREKGVSISLDAIANGISHTTFPARLELLSKEPVILLDGAHNPGGAASLRDAIQKHLQGYHKIAVVGMLADKDVHTALSLLIPLFDKVIAVSPDNPRAMSETDLAKIVESFGVSAETETDYQKAYSRAVQYASQTPNGAVIMFGSLYLASTLRRACGGKLPSQSLRSRL